MEPLDFLTIFRQRWKIILAAVLISTGVAWFTSPKTPVAGPSVVSYTATTTLIQAQGGAVPLNVVALTAAQGDVPKVAADALHYTGNPAALAATVSITPDAQSGTLTVAANDPDGSRATAVANAFAAAINTTLSRDAQQRKSAQISAAQASLKAAVAQLNDSSKQLRAKPGDIFLQAQHTAYNGVYQQAITQLVAAYGLSGTGTQLTVLQQAAPVPVVTGGGFAAPRSHLSRVLLGIGVGLILGLLLALLIDRIDTRLRRREEIERAFRLPVVADVPHASRRERRSAAVAVLGDPVGRVAEAYRSLRTALTMWPSHAIAIEAWGPQPDPEPARSSKSPKVVLVTSARAGEGKTTTAANLAATLAETGKRVLVIDADFRNPCMHRMFDVPAGGGLANLLAPEGESDLGGLARLTDDTRIRVLTAGHSEDFRGGMPTRIAAVIAEARTYGDAVVIDAAPLLSSNDAADFLPYVDSVVVVARLGRVNRAQAGRVADMLGRTRAPVLGVVCIGKRRRFGDSYPRFGTSRSSGSRKRRGRAKAASESGAT